MRVCRSVQAQWAIVLTARHAWRVARGVHVRNGVVVCVPSAAPQLSLSHDLCCLWPSARGNSPAFRRDIAPTPQIEDPVCNWRDGPGLQF